MWCEPDLWFLRHWRLYITELCQIASEKISRTVSCFYQSETKPFSISFSLFLSTAYTYDIPECGSHLLSYCNNVKMHLLLLTRTQMFPPPAWFLSGRDTSKAHAFPDLVCRQEVSDSLLFVWLTYRKLMFQSLFKRNDGSKVTSLYTLIWALKVKINKNRAIQGSNVNTVQ